MSMTPERENKIEKELSAEVKGHFENSQMSKAGRLAMELNAERKRLKEEMDDLQSQVEDLSPATPQGTLDSYVKWFATILSVIGVFLISAGITVPGQVCYALAAISWTYVGHCWNDKAIMIGSAITGTAVCMNLTEMVNM